MPLDALSDISDDALLVAFGNGDMSAARALTTRLTPRILGYATRMLGDMVEMGAEVKSEEAVETGQIIGWIECLKAASDLFCVVDGTFVRGNPDLNENADWLQKDPYSRGWLYEAKRTPEPDSFTVEGYVTHLDRTINKMLGETNE